MASRKTRPSARAQLQPARHSARTHVAYAHFAALFAIALALRLAHVLAMRQSPYFNHPVIDAQTYYQAAVSIASGHGHPDRVFWQPPGYSYFLAILYAFAGVTNFLAPRIVQALLGASSAVLTAWIGSRRFGPRAGLIAGSIVAAYGTLIYFDGELLGASLTVFLQLGAVALAVLALDLERPGQAWLGAGLLAGLASVVTATSLIVALVVAAAARKNFVPAVLGTALAIAPVSIRNMTHGGEFVPISSNGGINLYIGNNPDYDRTVAIRPDRVWTEFTKEPFEHGVSTKAGASNYWTGRVFQWAAKDPVAFASLQLKKLRLFLGGNEIYRNAAIYPARRDSPVLAALLWKIPGFAFPFGLLAPLGILGIAVGWRKAPLLAALVVFYSLGVLAFFVAARYRVPLVPYLAIFAVDGARWIAQATSPRRLAGVAALIALFVLCNAGQGRMSSEMNADAEFSLGEELHHEGNLAAAEEHYRSAIRERPDYLEAWVNLGVLELTRGNSAEGEHALEHAVQIDPRDPTALMSLAALRERQNRWAEALALYVRASEANPNDTYARERVTFIRDHGLSR
jgi:tetratricopeptide (TPR) repeat protein